jgi:hypothetical protein
VLGLQGGVFTELQLYFDSKEKKKENSLGQQNACSDVKENSLGQQNACSDVKENSLGQQNACSDVRRIVLDNKGFEMGTLYPKDVYIYLYITVTIYI